jgi:hypothetical protein
MTQKKSQSDRKRLDQVMAEARVERERREKSYRERALKMFPWICAHCGREFTGKRLRELTVHHKDHNHDNNPPDGSNWELLCLYCHDNEHSRESVADAYGATLSNDEQVSSSFSRPFADLAVLLKEKK